MKNMKSIIALMALSAATSLTMAASFPVSEAKVTIPKPPQGERWILDDEYSDEFNATKLDTVKWYGRNPGWAGRPPGLFLAENVSLTDGYLKIKGGTLDKPVIVEDHQDGTPELYTLTCGSIVSKGKDAHYGYYETRAKANKTPLSTTFWLSSGGYDVEGNQPEGMPAGQFSQELDICETIGRGGLASEGWSDDANGFHKGMNSNVHCWLRPDDGSRVDMVIPKLPGARPADGSVLSDGFNTYGCLWIDKEGAEFFMNNVSNGGRVDFVTTTGQKFYVSKPMGMRIWVETYKWIPTPKDEELADPTKNASYYDWIRHYVLVDIDDEDVEVAPAQCEVFEDYLHFTERKADGAAFEMIYTAPEDRDVIVEIYDGKKLVASQTYDAYAGFGFDKYEVGGAKLASGKEYTAVAYLVKAGAESSKGYVSGDSFSFRAK